MNLRHVAYSLRHRPVVRVVRGANFGASLPIGWRAVAELGSLASGDKILKFETFKRTEVNASDFVRFWRQLYIYPNSEIYDLNILKPLDENRIWSLYRWKNGTEISAKKRQSIESIYIRALGDAFPSLGTVEEGQEYLRTIRGGAIWDIFWLHCINPGIFPIFDQHTYRAMARIKSLDLEEIPTGRDAKLNAYFCHYIEFVKESFPGEDLRAVDKALFAYGRFLKTGYSRV